MTSTKERTYQIIIAVLVIVIFVGGWIMAKNKPGSSQDMMAGDNGSMASSSDMGDSSNVGMASSSNPAASGMNAPSGNTATASGESVSVSAQTAGMSVMVDSVSVSAPTWIAVRDSSGRTLGAGLIAAGAHTNVSVPLLRATESGQTYQVMLYQDDGDKMFSLKSDSLVMTDDGEPAGATFTAN